MAARVLNMFVSFSPPVSQWAVNKNSNSLATVSVHSHQQVIESKAKLSTRLTSVNKGRFSQKRISQGENLGSINPQIIPRLEGNNNNSTDVKQSSNNYVVLSTTVGQTARQEDYDFLAPLTALNWFGKGFVPILVVVSDNKKDIDDRLRKWSIILPNATITIPLVKPIHDVITVAQVARLVAGSLAPFLPDGAFLRTTDSDMMIVDRLPFSPSPYHEITIFNGRCCLVLEKHADGKICNQYPMHAVGMLVSKWRSLFSKWTSLPIDQLRELFDGQSNRSIKHAGKGWTMDQQLLGCVIDDAMKRNVSIELAPGPAHRLHIGQRMLKTTTDVHLAGFQLKNDAHEKWLRTLIQSPNIGIPLNVYLRYLNNWKFGTGDHFYSSAVFEDSNPPRYFTADKYR